MERIKERLLGVVLLVAVMVVTAVSVVEGYFVLYPTPQLTLEGQHTVEVAAHTPYVDQGFVAFCGRTDLRSDVRVQGKVDTTKPGEYILTYDLSFGGKTLEQRRTVRVVDKEAPALELLGESGLKFSTRALYVEPGFTAIDRCDGDMTAAVSVEEKLEGETLTLTYRVRDKAGNEATAQRLVTIRDEVAPVISLYGNDPYYLPLGGSYSEPGYSAEDDVDGGLKDKVTCSGNVNTGKVGTYWLTYSVADAGGNVGTETREVVVYGPSDGTNRLYLTFDDGPSDEVTLRVLNTLAAYDAKATFFILNYSSGNAHLIRRMIDEGHTVGIHGYSHDYGTIYRSDDAFMENIYALRNKLQADFGYTANIIRFPGGSSNTVSSSYSSGIMTRLIQRVQAEGFAYFDWNVSSGDASGNGVPSSSIYANVTGGMRPGRDNVVLMHDTNAKYTTADALESIIHYALANGYALLPLTADVGPVHHGVNN